MTSKMIMKIKNRPNFYYFDRALKDGKLITIKYSLFTNDIFIAKALAVKIKATITQFSNHKISNSKNLKPPKSFSSFEAYINFLKKPLKSDRNFIDHSEYREIFNQVVVNFYSPEILKSSQIKLNEEILSPNIKIEKTYSLKLISKEFIKTECVKQKSSEDTKARYLLVAREFDKFIKAKSLSKVSYQDAENFINYLLKTKKLHPKTINNYLSYAKKMFDYALKIGAIKENPFKLVTSFKISNHEKSPKDNFTFDELKLILKIKDKSIRNFILLALHTGLRLGEIWSLDSSSLGTKDGIKHLRVKTLKQKDEKFREIPVHRNIDEICDLRWLECLKRGKESYNYFGKRLNKHIHKTLPNSNVSFHRLRGNFAYLVKNYALENGLNDITSHLLGHSGDIATNIYAKEITLKAKLLVLKGLDVLGEIKV